jgi:lipoate-protein ligase A
VHNKIDVVRRITGGRAVLHDIEVTYAVVSLNTVFPSRTLQETYQLIAEALHRGLQQWGILESSLSLHAEARSYRQLPQCFVGVSRYEIHQNQRKIIGSAQKRSRDRFLQHGSILLDFNAPLQQGCVLQPDAEIEMKIAPLNRLLGRQLGFSEVMQQFTKAFEITLEARLEPSDLSASERSLAAELENKYRSEDWTRSECR